MLLTVCALGPAEPLLLLVLLMASTIRENYLSWPCANIIFLIVDNTGIAIASDNYHSEKVTVTIMYSSVMFRTNNAKLS